MQRVVCEPATPPSPEAKRIETPRAPSCAYAVQRLLREVSYQRGRRLDSLNHDSLGKGARNGVLVLSVTGGQDLRGSAFAQKEVDDVQEALESTIVEVFADRDEESRDFGGNAHGILYVEILEGRGGSA